MIKALDEADLILVEACLDKIKEEMKRLTWNKFQKNIETPFDNSGQEYVNSVFAVRSYDWNGANEMPNFEYKSLQINWYKYCGRGMYGVIDDADYNIGFFKTMIADCISSLKQIFEVANGR